jgi:hypothetical protein
VEPVRRARKAVLRLTVLLAAVVLASCSGITPYRSDLAKNLRIEPKTSSGSLFQTLNAGVNVYEVDAKCQLVYLGTVKLKDSALDVGLAANRQIYLEFYFIKSAVLYSSSSSVDYGLLLRPRPAHEYTAEVSYANDLYKVQLWEKARSSAPKRLLERRSLQTCVPS